MWQTSQYRFKASNIIANVPGKDGFGCKVALVRVMHGRNRLGFLVSSFEFKDVVRCGLPLQRYTRRHGNFLFHL